MRKIWSPPPVSQGPIGHFASLRTSYSPRLWGSLRSLWVEFHPKALGISLSLSRLQLHLPWTWTSLPREPCLELPEELSGGWMAQRKHCQVPTMKYFNMALFIFYFISGSKMCLPKEEWPDRLARPSAGSLPSGPNLPWQYYFPQPLSSSKQTVLPTLSELSSCLKSSSLQPS